VGSTSPLTFGDALALAGTLGRAVATLGLDTLAPPTCAACDERLARRAVLCPPCAAAVIPARRLPPGPGGAEGAGVPRVAYAVYGGPLAAALRRLKYDDRPDLAGPLGHLLRHAARSQRLSGDVVVPVPLHPARLADRGYNQAALLAAAVSSELRAPLAARALVRGRRTDPQARLARAERWDNVAGAFRARAPGSMAGLRVVLVDDVATTGATLGACALALREAGARQVTALVVAVADAAADGPEEDG
jgi:ComF family protein